jgi:hypothetical protein
MKWSDLDPTEDWTWELRGKLVLAAWAIAAVASAFPEPVLLLALPLFPLGLLFGIPGLGSLFPPPVTPPANPMSEFLLPMTVGWLMYLVVSLTATIAKKRSIFLIFYLGLILLLIFNVRGCQSFLKQVE